MKNDLPSHVVIAGAARTPVGVKCGTLCNCSAEDLAVLAADEAIRRSGVARERIDAVVGANVFTYLDTLAPESFDLAVADPPYAKGLADRLVKRYMRIPFARILSVEHGAGERLELPATAEERRYGDTVIAFIVAADLKEEEQ